MKKIITLLLAVFVLAVALAGCGEDATAGETDPTENHVVAVDDSQLTYGKLTIFVDGEFTYLSNIVDYVEGDPANLDPYHHYDIIGIYATQQQGSSKVENEAVLADGSIIKIRTCLRVLPREQSSFILNGESKDKYKILLRLGLDNDEYTMSIVRPGKVTKTINHVLDVWKAYDTVYWMVGDIVYSLNWWDEEVESAEVYYEGAVGVSHCSDEAEGALVPLDKANLGEVYGRHDRYSPYGDRLSKH